MNWTKLLFIQLASQRMNRIEEESDAPPLLENLSDGKREMECE